MLFGKLTLEAIPYHEPILIATFAGTALGGLVVLALMTYYKKWGWLWREWLTSVDHKKIGVMYIFVALVMLLRGFADAIMMRTQLALAHDGGAGILPPHHYDQIFTAHGVIMIFFMAMPFITGLMNLVVPLQIGARDVAFPFLNSLSFWLFVAGVVLIMLSLFVGEFAQTGWLAFPPLSGLQYSPGVGVDYYIWALQISGLGTTLTGINFLVTILKMRAPGMKLMHMPIFTWTALITNILMIAAFPFLTVSLALLTADRYLGTHFFTNDGGGNAMMYINLIWIWGHPEVYILILPCFGVFSEVVSTFSRKPLFGYTSMVWATSCIGLLSFIVWLHHFFTMGSGANVNAFFGITTMIIAVPTGVKIFNWLFTMFRGRLQMTSMMYWTVGFMVTFTIGGMTGVMMAIPAVSFVLHNSLFLIAHFHNVIIGGVVFGCLCGLTYWFPKAFGFKLIDKLGKASFWCWIVGFFVAFMPLYVLGFLGMTRRLNSYNNPEWTPWLMVAAGGAVIIGCGIFLNIVQIAWSIIKRKENPDLTGDPWDGRTLEWATSSPAPFYNFAHLPKVNGLDQHWRDKEAGTAYQRPTHFEDIHMPRNTAIGVWMGAFSVLLGFGMIWHIWWMAIIGLVGMIGSFLVRAFDDDIDYYVPAAEVARIENARYDQLDRLRAAKTGAL
ncbi:cytochrome o ubiquinol oxidase subunit 1 [Pseudoxanthomonas sp. SORGH_AS 997]|uniref:Cytochrome bo(3) ubiquinol oxidase subunit 1 n=1 Tax=Pseudoxanthomonas winnipegensis TaxID=2480810 RepID=A0AAW8GEF3_9GAMM|nr:cytochrome o ubiquinol oxidase subunit 1 [Pseudoxanthomonas winnipegensis]MDQ1132717.1 cytochrome o ubiquinol oxidase subunit 1 [Pseudoxanthomonas winnipegensis]MDR6137275.1 cytochrome o ubiquinol oxidase subunit 1 [Pseudoxanthomonas sp. SORGH_AS_0997]